MIDWTETIERWAELCANNEWRAVIMMSGAGSNAIKILQAQTLFKGLNICGIFTDNEDSQCESIAQNFWLKSIKLNQGKFESMYERIKYFEKVQELFRQSELNLAIYAGFMKIVPDFFAKNFPGINSHPADLLIKDSSGKPRYVGMPVIKMAIEDGQESICCSCCTVSLPVDTGVVIAQSDRIAVSRNDLWRLKDIHSLLKEKEHEYYPQAIADLCSGRIKELFCSKI
jgi:folate-dependent phosphoribosylglycinamide formyltransferase PurN